MSDHRGHRETIRHGLAEEIVSEIAAVAEAAYRRGFQQGHEAAGRGDALAFDLITWRFSMKQAFSPEQLNGGRIIPALERLHMQAPRLVDKVRAAIDPTHGIE